MCIVNAMHITASIFINDDESGLHHDYEVWLEKVAPHEPVSGYLWKGLIHILRIPPVPIQQGRSIFP